MIDHQDLKIAVWQRDGKYLGYVKELAILEEAGSLADLWDRVNQRKEEICRRLDDEGLTLESINPGMAAPANTGQLPASSSKTVPLLMATGLALLIVGYGSIAFLRSAGSQLTSELKARATPNYVAAKLESLSDEEKEKIHGSLRVINEQLRPFVSDIKPLLSDFSAPAECPPPHGSGAQGRAKK
jgi:hypothetical protein